MACPRRWKFGLPPSKSRKYGFNLFCLSSNHFVLLLLFCSVNQHYEDNRSKNRIVRQDIPIAKQLQKTELLEACRARAERRLKNEIESDEMLAKQIEHRLWLEEQNKKKATEEADERLAKKLVEKEKARQIRKRLQKEKQQVERLSIQIGADYCAGTSEGPSSSNYVEIMHSKPTYHRILTEDDQELDLSEFCMPPPPGLTPEELKYFLEEQDAEIARLLQRQELKRSKNPEKEKLAVIEAQDYEIAKMLQKQEKDRVRRIKERVRARQQRQKQEFSGSNGELSNTNTTNYQRASTPISPQTSLDDSQIIQNEEHVYDIPESNFDCDADSETYEEPYQILSQQNDARLKQNFHNIAIDLDPTYQRRIQSNQQSPLMESCVDDDDDDNPIGEQMESLSSMTRSHDSLELTQRANRFSDTTQQRASTTSSRSSRGSSSSHHSSNRSNKSADPPRCVPDDSNEEDYAPPLPPRDVSLLSRNKTDSDNLKNSINLLPPHHPQHPNRRTTESASPNSNYQLNRSSFITPTSNLPIPGQRRVMSMEKQKKDRQRHQDGCKTQ